tara:strand:- start:563 stop:2722 length:2160 start_codon:yes stop_codon:yes gene_type:complete
MTVKQEVKGQLAKLLATEDLIVEHKRVETAQFNVQTRVLTLPVWDKASNDVYDMLVGHEVGHALYTPDEEWWEEYDINPNFVNIAEDARVEKLMKRKYAGIAKTFYRGYNDLNNSDFFEVDGKDINSLNLADRANLHFKIGAFTNISFSTPEKEIIDLIANAETFTETLSAAEALYNFCKQELEKKQKEETKPNAGVSIDGGGNSNSDSSDLSESTVDQSDTNASVENGSGSDDNNTRVDAGSPVVEEVAPTNQEPQVETADALEQALKDLSNLEGRESTYFELPKVDLEKIIVSNEDIHNNCNTHWVDYVKNSERSYEDIFFNADSDFIQFKRDAQKEVNYLVKEFECKKSASAYARAATSRTGILDTRNLHTYKFNEDLFKKVTILPDGKNHGLIFILDWSGSMGEVLLDTIKQLYNLIWFCKKVSIPFDVYAFTNEYPHHAMEEDRHGNYVRSLAYTAKSGLAAVGEHFSLMNFFSSDVKAKDLDNQLLNIWRIAYAHRGYGSRLYDIPLGMHLSGTPLNEAMVCLHEIIPQFKNKNGVEKVQCVVLTDGEAHPLCYHREVHRPWEDEPYMGVNQLGYDSYLRNRKTGNTYNFNGHWYTFTRVLLRDLKDSFPDTNFIGIRILANRDAGSFIRTYSSDYEETEKLTKSWKKNKSFSLRCAGYDTYFGLSSAALDNDTDFEVKEDATKAQIRSAFKKSLNSKKMNKKILGEFVELVA